MAVLIEAISVVVKADRLLNAFGSFDAFKKDVPNLTLAADDELARVGFMTPEDVANYVQQLERRGLVHLFNGVAMDIVVMDQMRGSSSPCEWVEFGHVDIKGRRVAAARRTGSKSSQIVTPEGWVVEGSLSETFGFVPSGQEGKSLRFLRHENGVDVFWNALTSTVVYVGRTGEDGNG